DRRVATGTHALAFLEGEHAVGRGFTVIDAKFFLEVFARLHTIAQGTGQVGAYGNLEAAHRALVEHVVESGDFLNGDGRYTDVGCHVGNDVGRNPALLFLSDGQGRHNGGLPLVCRELGEFPVDSRSEEHTS